MPITTKLGFLLLIVLMPFVLASATTLPTIDKQSNLGVRSDVERAMWVWNSEDIVYSVGNSKSEFFSFCESSKGFGDPAAPAFSQRGINHLFFNAHGFVVSGQEEMDSLRAFLREAHTRGMRIDYLDGEPTWINKDAGEANQVINSVLSFNAQGAPEERFDGVMLDVQPYTLRGWYTPALWNQYLTFLRTMNTKIHASDKNLQFGASIPRWYDATLGTQALADVYNAVNFVTILDHVNNERALVESISNEIELADSMNIRVFAGVETASSVLSNVTFQDAGWLAMEQALASLNSSYILNKSYAGVAVSNYASYRTMRRASHAIDLAATMNAHVGNSVQELLRADAEVLVLDGAFEHVAGLQKKEIQKMQNANGRAHTVLAGVSIAKLMNLAAYPGVPAAKNGRAMFVGENGPSVEMTTTVSKLLAMGFDGFSVDLTPAVELAQKLNDPSLQKSIVKTVSILGDVARESCKRSSSVIVVRGGESLLNELDAESYSAFVSTVDGMMPTHVTSAPALLSALDRDRFYIYASLEKLAQSGVKIFGDFNFVISGDLAAGSQTPKLVPVMADMR